MFSEEMVSLLAAQTGLTKAKASEVLEVFEETVIRALSKGEQIQLTNFGTFFIKSKAATVGRNPMTGKEYPIPARKVPSFKPGKLFREAMGY